MPALMQRYKSREQMYHKYSSPAKEIEFEGHVYTLKGSYRTGDYNIHLYHCEQEQHYIRVTLQFNEPFLIEGIYSVGEVSL